MTKNKMFVLLLIFVAISLAACTSEEKPLEASEAAASSEISDTTTLAATDVQEGLTTSITGDSAKNEKYIAFPDISREEEQDINKWILQTSRAACAFCYDTYRDSYYFSWINGGFVTETFNAIGGFYKMDGKTRKITKLSDDAADSLKIYGDWIYFANAAEFNMLFKMRFDGTERQRVTDMTLSGFEIAGDEIILSEKFLPKYYMLTRGYDIFGRKFRRLSRIALDGSGYEIVSEIQHFPIRYIEPYIYAREMDWERALGDIWRYDKDDFSEPTLVLPADGENRILFFDNERTVFRESVFGNLSLYEETKSGEKRKICSVDMMLNFLGIINGEIYCSRWDGDGLQLFRVSGFDHAVPLSDTKYPKHTLFEIAGDYILARNSEGLTLISSDGEYEELLIRPDPPVDWDTVAEMQRKIAEIQGVVDYFQAIEIYGGEKIDFEGIPELGYKVALDEFFVFPQSADWHIPNLLNLSAEELIGTKLTLEDIEGLRRRFEYLKELVNRYF